MRKINLWPAALVFALVLVLTVSAQSYGSCPMGGVGGIYGGYGTGMMVFSWITYILVIGLIVAGIYWLIKSANRKK